MALRHADAQITLITTLKRASNKFMQANAPGAIAESLLNVRVAMPGLQAAVAKHNASFRVRFPHSDPIYKLVEASFFGAFDDIPRQIHAFVLAVEEFAHSIDSMDGAFSVGCEVQGVLEGALAWAGVPPRNKRGRIVWRKSLSHLERDLLLDIKEKARTFFLLQYTCCHCGLNSH